MKTIHAVRIIGHLLDKVRLNSSSPILSYVPELVGDLVEKSEFGTKTGKALLVINENGDLSNQFMFENIDEVVKQISALVIICFAEFGDVEILVNEIPQHKVIELIFKPMKME